MKTDKSRLQEFLYGFAKGADIDLSQAREQWAGHSAQLSDDKRRLIESQGEDSGFTEGQAFAKLYPPIESDPEAMAAIELLKSRGLADQACDLLRDGVEISLERLEKVADSNPHFMFIGRHGELFATVKMHDMSVPEFRIVSHEDECKTASERMAYRTCLERGVAIAIGITVAEPVRDVETHPCPVRGEVVCVSDPVAAKA